MARPSRPRPEEVVGCQVDEVEIARGLREVDELKYSFAGRQGGCEQVAIFGEVHPKRI